MKKKTPFLDFIYEQLEANNLTCYLCHYMDKNFSFSGGTQSQYFRKKYSRIFEMARPRNEVDGIYWFNRYDATIWNEERLTFVLLLAAINNEL